MKAFSFKTSSSQVTRGTRGLEGVHHKENEYFLDKSK